MKNYSKKIQRIRSSLKYEMDEKYIYLHNIKQEGDTLLLTIVGELDENIAAEGISLFICSRTNSIDINQCSHTIQPIQTDIDSCGRFTTTFKIDLDIFIQDSLVIVHTFDFHLNINNKERIKYFIKSSTIFSNTGYDFIPYNTKRNNFSFMVIRKDAIAKPLQHINNPSISFILPRIDFFGGVTKVTLDLANALVENGYIVNLVVIDMLNNPNKFVISKKINFDYVSLSVHREGNILPKDVYNRKQTIPQSYANLMKKHLSSLKTDFVYYPIYGTAVFMYILEAIPNGIKKIIGDHSGRRYEHFDNFLTEKKKVSLAEVLNRTKDPHLLYNLSNVNALHVVNPLVKPIYTQITKTPILDIPNIVNVYQGKQQAFFTREKKITLIGRLTKLKNFSTIIKVFASLHLDFPNWSIEIYGEGPEKASLQTLIDSFSLEKKVFLKGFSSNIDKVLQNTMIHISASHKESFGLTMVEAMSHHVITISTLKTIGARYLIENEKTGFLASDNTEKELYTTLHKVMSLIEKKDPLIETIHNSAYTHSLQFNAKNTATNWDNALKGLLQ